MKSGLPQPTKIAKVIEENAQVRTFVLEAAVEADPGQFIMVWLPRVDEKPFSLVDADPVTITVARVGPFTEKLHQLRNDDRIWFRGPVTTVIGARSRADLVFPQRFAELGCSVVLATDDGSAGVQGLVTDVAKSLLERDEVDAIYACGPEAMLNKVLELCRDHGLSCQLSLEKYMRCGLGVCGSCQRGGMLVCRDGPVFAF
jgi:dihydroorotate dehydrogenase electron transfer subunit